MSSTAGVGLLGLVARLHQTLDALLCLDLTQQPQADLPEAVTGLVSAAHRLHAAQLGCVGALDATGLPQASRHGSTARWLQDRARVSPTAASGLLRSARALRDHLPATRDALAAGQVSAQHVQAITHVVRTVGVEHAVAAEPILLELARGGEPAVVRRAAAHLHAVLDPAGAQAALDRVYDQRGVTLSVVGTRAYLDGVLDVEAAETLQAALMPLMSPSPGDDRSAPQRRADALVDLARRALDAGTLPTLGGQRPHLTVVVEGRALGEGRGAGTLPWTGVAVPVTTVVRWGCDAHLAPVWAARHPGRGRWQPLAVGRASRTVTPAQHRALQVRDGGCVHPGCSRTAAFCDAHHVHHWAEGGRTDLANLVLLCRHHHRTLHAGHWQLRPPDAAADPITPEEQHRVHDWVAVLPGGLTADLQTATDRSPPLRPAV